MANEIVVDYAFGHPSFSSLTATKIRHVGRYVSENPVNDGNGKNLVPAEKARLRELGIGFVLFAEEGATDMLGGRAAGIERAHHFDAVVHAMDMPDAVMFCTCDFDATPAQQSALNAYAEGTASVIGHDRTGGYGGYYPIMRMLNAGVISHAAQTFAWSRFSTAGLAEVGIEAAVGTELVDLLGNPYTLDTQHDQEPTHLTSIPGVGALAAAALPAHAVLVTHVAGRALPGTFLYDNRAGLRQGLIGNLGGAQVDFDEAVLADFGQWPRPKAPTQPSGSANRRLADGKTSLNAIASARGTSAAHIVSLSFASGNYNDKHRLQLALYLLNPGPDAPLPEGFPYYTTN